MRGLLVTVGTILVLASLAYGGNKKVTIETDPPGATVYLGSTETTPVCEKTPCEVVMPATETPLFIQKAGFQPILDSLDPSDKKLTKIKKTLEPATGAIVISDAKGAGVSVDDEDKGKAPGRFELSEGAHHLVITGTDGKALLDEMVEVKIGEDATIDVGVGGAGNPGGGGGEDPKDDPNNKITKPATPTTHEHYVRGSVATDIGFRSFTYANNTTKDALRDVTEGGEVLVGPMVELWPMEILGIPKGRGLSLMGKVQFHVNHQPVANQDTMSLTTFWQAVEVLARYKYIAADVVGIEALVGYGNESYRFNGLTNEVDLVPDAQYQSVKFGVRVSAVNLVDGKVEPYLEAENRIVVSSGAVGTRFTGGSSVSGLHGALGLAFHIGPVVGRLEGALTRYSWDFKANSTSDMHQATGATDQISQIAIDVGYQY